MRTGRLGILASVRLEHVGHVKRAWIFDRTRKTLRDIGVAQAVLRSQPPFYFSSDDFPRPRQLSRHGCLVLAEKPSNLRQREALTIVEAKPKPIAIGQHPDRCQ
jgi:hypothetical protein